MESMCAETAYLIELTAAFLRDEPVTLRPEYAMTDAKH